MEATGRQDRDGDPSGQASRLIGKYVTLPGRLPLGGREPEARRLLAHGAHVDIEWVASDDLETATSTRSSATSTGSSCPAVSACAASRGRSRRSSYARENGIPFLGICLGLQCAVIEFARNVAGLEGANSVRVRRDDALSRWSTSWPARISSRSAGRCDSGPTRASCRPGFEGGGGLRRRARLRAPPASLRGEPSAPPQARGRRARVLRASRPTGRWSRSSSWPITRGSSPDSSIPSSRVAPTVLTRCSAGFVGACARRSGAQPRSWSRTTTARFD